MTDDGIELHTLLAKANDSLYASQQIIQELSEDKEAALLADESLENRGRLFELVLQYRFDMQNALIKLLGFEPVLLQQLGIGPHYSEKINLERMTYALGNADLTQLIHMLGDLLHALLRIAHRYHLQEKSYREAHLIKKTSYKKFYLGLQKACAQQKTMLVQLDAVDHALKQLTKMAAIGPVLDHVVALRGPISQFHQALLNGLEQSQQLYQTVSPHLNLQNHLGDLLQKAELFLQQSPAVYPHPLFSPDQTPQAERLEQRAAAKRLGHFFNH